MFNIVITGRWGANVRKEPKLDSAIVRTAIFNESLGYVGKVSGDSVAGNKMWYQALDGYVWSGNVEEVNEVEAYSQRDNRWKNIRLGGSIDYPNLATRLYYMARGWLIPGSIGYYGCTITSIGSFVRMTPEVVDNLFDRYGVYLKGPNQTNNLVIWANISRALPSIKAVDILWSYDNAAVIKALKLGYGVLAEVNADPIGAPSGRHWVRMLGNGKIIDPWFGDIASTTRYSNYYSLRILTI